MASEFSAAIIDVADATPRQREIAEAYIQHGTTRKAAAALGVSPGNVGDVVRLLRHRASVRGFSPEHDLTHAVAPGYTGRGHSSLYDRDGKLILQWVKTRADDEARQAALDAAALALAETLPRLPAVPDPAPGDADLCNLFTLTDAHIGMLAWHREGGADWDLAIAEQTLVDAFAQMIQSAPRARLAVINQLGDLLHFDGLEAVTPTNRHILDADSRFRKVVVVAIRVLRRIIDMALATHDSVHVVMAEGNHDMASSVWLQVMFAAIYENEPRLTVNESALPYYVFRHGAVMLGFHHGHMKRPGQGIALHFAAAYPEIWGATTKRYIHMGNLHHVEEKEHPGAKVVQHSTLAARDAYAARGGWHSERQAIAITYHAQRGEVARVTVSPG